MKVHDFNCPYCWSEIHTYVETEKLNQQFIEECVKCSNPLEMIVKCNYGNIQHIMINPIAQ